MNNPSTNCPECGAPAMAGLTCWEVLGLMIAWEYSDHELRAQHFLIVAGYNLQHPAQFTGDALMGLRAAFIEHLDNGMAIEEIRRRVGETLAGNQRVLRPEAERQPRLYPWSMTIADVYMSGQPINAATRVRAWAASIRSEL